MAPPEGATTGTSVLSPSIVILPVIEEVETSSTTEDGKGRAISPESSDQRDRLLAAGYTEDWTMPDSIVLRAPSL